jgi:uncharacterized protein YceH (UPF0502 family)
MELTIDQSRILGAMIEKAMTTPANYPMSLNAVVVACNQVSNRDPVTDFSEDHVELVLRGLTDQGLAKMVHKPGDRVVKYRQALADELETSAQETALLAVLMLRGPQTPGELRQRTARYVEFSSLPELETVLADLSRRDLVRRLERQPGQKESRYEQLLTVGGEAAGTADPGGGPYEHESVTEAVPAASRDPVEPGNVVDGLRTELDDLKRRFEELLYRLGEEID